MSRYYEGDYDESFPNEAALWRANAERALKGKRGRKALAELREALRNLPEKRLIDSALCTVNAPKRREEVAANDSRGWATREFDTFIEQTGEGVCAVGAYAWWQKVKAGADPQEAFDSLPSLMNNDGDEIWQTEQVGVRAGLTQYVAWELAYRNDETYMRLTPEERYERFMTWLDEQLAEPVSA